jgi:hypothetical protein
VRTPPNLNLDLLSAVSWDIRATLELRVRTLTSMQRCVDDYRATPHVNTLAEISKHLAILEGSTTHIENGISTARQAVRALAAMHAEPMG